MGFPQRVAHRGGSHLAPENTLSAFQQALALPIDAIELDVQMSRDGYPVVFHDSTVERLTDGSGNLLDLDFAYLRSLNVAAHFPQWSQSEQMPTLAEALTFLRGKTKVYVELKYSKRGNVYRRYRDIAQVVVQEIQIAGMLNDVLVISFDWDLLTEVKERAAEIQTGALVSSEWWYRQNQPLQLLLDQARIRGCEWVNIDFRLFEPPMLELIHQAKLYLGLWTVNTEETLRYFAEMGIDSLTTDRPDLFRDL